MARRRHELPVDRPPQDRRSDRSAWERGADEVAAWMGDEAAQERRDAETHRGRGPKGYFRSDPRILEDVCDRLTDDGLLDASEIEVRVEDGEVSLDGRVSSRSDKHRAEELSGLVSGVKHVQNNLRVPPASEIPDNVPV